jgi:hypothetical protein
MKATFDAHIKAHIEITLPKHRVAAIAFPEKAFCADSSLLRFGRLYGYFFLLKPCHDDRGKDCHEMPHKTNLFTKKMLNL